MNAVQKWLRSIAGSENSANLLENIGETAADQLLNDGLLKDIPIVGAIFSLLKAGNEIAAFCFAKKISAFLTQIESIPREQREKFIADNMKTDDGEHVGEVTLMILEKLDSALLAEFLGRAFAELLKSTEPNARQIFDYRVHVIKNLSSYLVSQLRNYYGNKHVKHMELNAASMLANLGLMKQEASAMLSGGRGYADEGRSTDAGANFYEVIVKPSKGINK